LALAVKYLHPSPPGDRFMRTPPALKRSAPGETNPAALLVLQRPVRSISTVSPSVPHRLAISTATLLPRFFSKVQILKIGAPNAENVLDGTGS